MVEFVKLSMRISFFSCLDKKATPTDTETTESTEREEEEEKQATKEQKGKQEDDSLTNEMLKTLYSAIELGDSNPKESMSIAATLLINMLEMSSPYMDATTVLLQRVSDSVNKGLQLKAEFKPPLFLKKAVEMLKKQKALNELHSEMVHILSQQEITISKDSVGHLIAGFTQAQEDYMHWNEADDSD